MLNKVILMGRFTKDPERKSTPQGVSVCSFSLAVQRNFKNNGNYESDFINCTAWRSTADFISMHFKKGNLVCVEGSLQTRNYEYEGQKRTVAEVVVENTYFVESKGTSSSGTSDEVVLPQKTEAFSSEEFSSTDDDLPF